MNIVTQNNIILGIDFGTNNTVISFFENNKPKILMDGVFKSIKTKVGIKNGLYTCGNYVNLNSDKIIYNFKTKIGETDDLNKILIIFFNHLKKIISMKFPNYNFRTVFTTPSNFNNIQREIIKDHLNAAGFDIIRIINEPSAAALSYGLLTSCDDESKILVVDLGGGTLDLTVLVKDNNYFEILHSIGLNDLGGNDFTDVIYKHILNQYNDFDEDKLNNLWFVCQNAKEKLSWVDEYKIIIKLYNKMSDLVYDITIKKFEFLFYHLIEKIKCILINIQEKFNDIEYIILVGCASKMPIIKKIIKDIFKIDPWIHNNLDLVVAEGACIYGAILEKVYKTDNDILLVDVLPLSLGVEMIDGSFSIIIPKDTPLPIKKKQIYTTDTPGDNVVNIKIYQGEHIIANKNTLIGEIIFDQVSICETPQIIIAFSVDNSSLITVSVLDKKQNIEKNILIKNIIKLNIDEINNLISLANECNIIDEEDMLKINRTHLLSVKIETAMNNIKLNSFITNENKDILLKELCDIELSLHDNPSNLILLNLLKNIDDNFANWLQHNIEIIDVNTSTYNELEKLMIIELKDELYNKVINLLNNDSSLFEYLNPILEELCLSNISLEYLQSTLQVIKDLEEDEDEPLYIDQYRNLCLSIKNQIDEGFIKLHELQMCELSELIDESLLLFNNNLENSEWEIELNIFNKKCEDIYNMIICD